MAGYHLMLPSHVQGLFPVSAPLLGFFFFFGGVGGCGATGEGGKKVGFCFDSSSVNLTASFRDRGCNDELCCFLQSIPQDSLSFVVAFFFLGGALPLPFFFFFTLSMGRTLATSPVAIPGSAYRSAPAPCSRLQARQTRVLTRDLL
jgi:hypothetical protein